MAIKYFIHALTMIIAAHYCTSLALDGGDTLLLGASLTGNQTLFSENGMFALGFFSPRGTSNWYIGIWYSQIPEKTIVWVANRDNPVRNMPGVLQFSRDGHLGLFDGKGVSVWSTDIGQKGSQAVITDSGNFIVLDGNNKSEIVWESFAHPGDTWLPGMKFWPGMKLTSRKSSVDPAIGVFSFGIKMSPAKTQMVFVYNNSVPYWSTGDWLWSANYFTNIHELQGDKTIQISCVKNPPSSIYFNFRLEQNLVGRLVLQENGRMGLYYLMGDHTWNLMWSTNGGQCSAYDICGAYQVCYANEVCGCVEGFTPNNDSKVWRSSGCKRRRPLQCSATNGTTDEFFEAKNLNLSEKEAVLYNNQPTQQSCRSACLNNCSCTAFAFANSHPPVCRLWFGDLVKMHDSSAGQSVFIRLAASELRRSTSEGSSKAPARSILLPVTVAAIALVVAFLLLGFLLWRGRRQPKTDMEEDVPASLKTFTYKELRFATQNFKHKLGSGAFGSVFKGTLPDNTLVAVKRLEGSGQVEKQFRAEISTIGTIQHVNLVRLWGFCVEGSRRLLVYAYMPNGSLKSFLFCKDEETEKVLDWKTRFGIALGTARGLLYLHEECRDRIIHCDIKPENILLDDDFSPKVADFGLAKLVGRDFSRVLTTTRGTRGYLAPEWVSGLPITSKADVFSFGMTLLEIISGRRNLDLNVAESRFYFPTWASSQIQRGNIIGVVDARIANEADIEEVGRAAMVGMLCIQDDENRRPSMGEVVKILEGTIEVPALQIPRSVEVQVNQVDDEDSYSFQFTSTSKPTEGREGSNWCCYNK